VSLKFAVEHYEETDACRATVKRIIDFAQAQWLETLGKSGEAFQPDIDQIANMWRDGSVKIISARDGAELTGYALWIVSPNLWRPRRLDAVLYSVFLRKESRGIGEFPKLMDFGVMVMEALGVKKIATAVDSGSDLHSYFARKGWVAGTVTMVKS
jgi:hypothetical protein